MICICICTAPMRPNQRTGAYSYAIEAIRDGRPVKISGPHTVGFHESEGMTRNAAEVEALNRALERFKAPCDVTVFTHCNYTYNCIRDCLPEKWRAQGWKNDAGKEPAHRDKWERYLKLSEGFTIKADSGPYRLMETMLREVKTETARLTGRTERERKAKEKAKSNKT